MNKINISIKAYDSALVDSAAIKVIEVVRANKVDFSGPVPLPTKREVFTILRSVHVNKKSREQFERRTHKRLIVVNKPTNVLMEKLKRIELPAGVFIEIAVKDKK